jgi:hypothetical protein
MRKRLTALMLPLAAGLAFLVWTGSALAGTTQISGTFPNGGCGQTHNVFVGGPSRIDAAVSTTSASNRYWIEIVDGNGNILSANGSYDTKSGGQYGVRVCSPHDLQDPNAMQYSGEIGTGPAGQPALPQQQAQFSFGVLGKTTTVKSRIIGHGAIITKHGLAWVTVRATDLGQVRVRVDSVGSRVHLNYTSGMRAVFGSSTVRITGHALVLTLVDRGSHDPIAIKSSRLKASGRVVRGGFQPSI